MEETTVHSAAETDVILKKYKLFAYRLAYIKTTSS